MFITDRQIFAFFRNLVSPILYENYVKGLRVAKFVKDVKLEGIRVSWIQSFVLTDNHSNNI